jgi:dynein regulatory complex protein 1
MENTEELAKEVQKQTEECQKILATKDQLIKELEDELVQKDEDYKETLKKMGTDIDQIIEEMRKQFYEMRNLYGKELFEIEDAFKKERIAILEKNKKEIDKLLAEHDEQERSNQHLRLNGEEEYSKRLEDDRKKNVSDYMAKKMLLEQEKQSIERALEELKSVFVLNQAMLEYNVKVLEEKKKENEEIKKDVVAKVKSYREKRIKLKSEISKQATDAEKENKKLTTEYERFAKQFEMLQEKFKHFQKADNARFDEIRKMNEAEVKTLMQKIIKADKVIQVQQLGLKWTPPSEYIVNYIEGTNAAGMTGMPHDTSSMPEGSRMAPKSEGGEEQSAFVKDLEKTVPIAKVNEVFRILINEASFLVDIKTREECKTANDAKKFALQIEALCNALSIESGDVGLLVSTFYEESKKPKDTSINISGAKPAEDDKKKPGESKKDAKEEEKKEAEHKVEEPDEQLHIDPDNVIGIMEEFTRRRRERMELPEMSTNQNKRKRKAVEAETERIEKERKKDREHWEKLSQVLDEAKLNLWNALYTALSKYYKLLQERQILIEETGMLNQQNEELKTLLNQYLLAGVNQELKIPPTQVIRLDV